MAQQKIVHIVGTGTIGEPLIGILSTFKEQFGIDEVTFHKRTPLLTDRSKVLVSCDKGAKLAVDKDRWQKFVDMGMKPSFEAEEAIERASVIIDCTPVGNREQRKTLQQIRQQWPRLYRPRQRRWLRQKIRARHQ